MFCNRDIIIIYFYLGVPVSSPFHHMSFYTCAISAYHH